MGTFGNPESGHLGLESCHSQEMVSRNPEEFSAQQYHLLGHV